MRWFPGRWILIWHRETGWNRARQVQGQTDVPLNPGGRAQARARARTLRGVRLDLILMSDPTRASPPHPAGVSIRASPVGCYAPAEGDESMDRWRNLLWMSGEDLNRPGHSPRICSVLASPTPEVRDA